MEGFIGVCVCDLSTCVWERGARTVVVPLFFFHEQYYIPVPLIQSSVYSYGMSNSLLLLVENKKKTNAGRGLEASLTLSFVGL